MNARQWVSMACALGMTGAAHAAAGTGAYPATMIEEASLREHVVYRPQNLAAFGGPGKRLPIVAWGNGGCANAGNAAQEFLSELASHGYLAIASGPIREQRQANQGNAAPAQPTPPPAPAATPPAGPAGAAGATQQRIGPPPGAPGTENLSRTAQLLEAIAWAEAENKRAGSPYFDKLDTSKVATMGTSCGGLQAIEAAIDPRVTTTIAWSSGLLDQPRAGANVSRADLPKLHGPILYVVGGSNDIASPFAAKDFAAITAVPVVLAVNEGAGHGTSLNQPNGGSWAKVGLAWLNWQLKGDAQAGRQFTGAQCGLCTDATWSVQKKGIN